MEWLWSFHPSASAFWAMGTANLCQQAWGEGSLTLWQSTKHTWYTIFHMNIILQEKIISESNCISWLALNYLLNSQVHSPVYQIPKEIKRQRQPLSSCTFLSHEDNMREDRHIPDQSLILADHWWPQVLSVFVCDKASAQHWHLLFSSFSTPGVVHVLFNVCVNPRCPSQKSSSHEIHGTGYVLSLVILIVLFLFLSAKDQLQGTVEVSPPPLSYIPSLNSVFIIFMISFDIVIGTVILLRLLLGCSG